MNKKLDLSSIKVNDYVLVTVAMVLLAIILGVAAWFTFKQTMAVKDSINTTLEVANTNRAHIAELEEIKANQNKYEEEFKQYDAVIAPAGSYTTLENQMDLEEMLIKYNLKGTAVSGKLEPFGSVQTARSTIEVVGKESDVKNMCKEIVSSKYIVRIDDFAMADNGDGTVTAAFSIVNFTK